MDAILNFLKGIADVVASWFDNFMIRQGAEAEVTILITDFIGNLSDYVSWMPVQVYQIISVGFTFCVIYVLLGRC